MNRLNRILRSTRTAALLLSAIAAQGAMAAEPVKLRYATVGVGSSWYVYGTGTSKLMLDALPAGSSVDVLPIAGGVGNMELIENGEADLAITFSHTAGEACLPDGGSTFDTQKKKVRALLGGLDTYYLAALVTERSGITSWEDIASGKKPVRLITTKVGGTGELGIRQVLDAYGASYDSVRKAGGTVRALARTATSAAIADGTADFWGHTISPGHPIATELTTLTKMRILPIDGEERLTKLESLGWNRMVMPANTFEGQTSDIPIIGTVSNIVISSDVSDETAYALAKSLFENANSFPGIHAALKDFTLERGVDPAMNGNCAFHPGAEAYYREAGLIK